MIPRSQSTLRCFAIAAILAMTSLALTQNKPIANITLQSKWLKDGQRIPIDFTEDGKNLSPPLEWKDLPKGTMQLALICDDPDAPTSEPWVHWVIYSIPATAKGLPQGLPSDPTLKEPKDLAGTMQGKNGWGRPGYLGPAPPIGKLHHYHFKLYALDAALILKPGLSKKELLKPMEGHIIGKGEIIVTYQR